MQRLRLDRWHRLTLPYRIMLALAAGVALLGMTLLLGYHAGLFLPTLPLIGTSILLEAQPGVIASIPLGFHPLTGAFISIMANLAPIPVMMVTFRVVVARWSWAHRMVDRSQKWSRRYGKYGVPVLVILAPFLGAYVSIAMGYGMGWKPLTTLASTVIGMVASVLILSYGGHFVVSLFTHP